MSEERQTYQVGDEDFQVFEPNEATGVSTILQRIAANPTAIRSMFGLSPEQATNVRALLAGGGAALGTKYLGDALGDEIAAAIGAIGGAFLARKVIGR